MSKSEKDISLQVATGIMTNIMTDIANTDVALRIQAVGSVRRHKAIVHDLEVMLIPAASVDLLGPHGSRFEDMFPELARKWRGQILQNGPKKKTLLLPEGIRLEMHVSQPESWPVELAIRTGPALFSKRAVTTRRQDGWLPSDCVVKDGWQVYRGETLIKIPTERDFLQFLGLGWVEPWDRHEKLVCGDSVLPIPGRLP